MTGWLYEFGFRGLLAEEALDKAGRQNPRLLGQLDVSLATTLSIDLLDPYHVENAQVMATVYTAISAFENSVRDFVERILIERYSETWWSDAFPSDVRKRAEKRRDDEQATRWHTPRGESPINYTELGDLVDVMGKDQHRELFEPYIRSHEWAAAVFHVVERARNVIMHSGSLEKADIERLGMNIRDWVRQVSI